MQTLPVNAVIKIASSRDLALPAHPVMATLHIMLACLARIARLVTPQSIGRQNTAVHTPVFHMKAAAALIMAGLHAVPAIPPLCIVLLVLVAMMVMKAEMAVAMMAMMIDIH